jgi:LysM repeat protein
MEDRYFDSSEKPLSGNDILDEERQTRIPRKSPPSIRRPFILLTICVGLLIVLMLTIWFRQEPADAALQNRLQMIETRLTNLENRINEFRQIDEQLAQLDFHNKELVAATRRLDQTNAAVSERMDLIAQELVELQRRTASTPPKEPPPRAPAAATPKETVAAPHHVVQKGETLYSISRRYKISLEELRRLNGLGNDNTIRPGQKLIVKPEPNP